MAINGKTNLACPLQDDWEMHRDRSEDAFQKVNEMHTSLQTLLQHTTHLEKLDVLPDIKNHLMEAATGAGRMEVTTATLVFKILGLVIFILALILGFLLVGEKFGIIGALHR